ncbi:YihY/virulence factor BrkB family protein [Leptolyngbya sp. FACHB-261]|uniref:YihY/virulence factor BrkB family protein n=1 Tax=Leptolyngbya sp. FACHB-261 TaxID=2692806 RepID=UPI00168591ED|nr:YihY/virulence factor BrkB family protein [Leptolyngbya sp. FACHB-261]MBD2101798.1 YihY/virulence factor BrkB family protein [Leptolyngbya sp. FACHB-261]
MKPQKPDYIHHLSPKIFRSALVNAAKQRLPGLASEMAYSTMLALFPAILAALTAVGLFGSSQATFDAIMGRLQQIAPQEVLVLVQDYVRAISYGHNSGLLSLSFFVALWAASGAVGTAMVALDLSHEVPVSKLRPFWKARLLSLLLMLGMLLLIGLASGVLFFSGLVLTLVATQAGAVGLGPVGSLLLWGWNMLTWPITLGIVTVACMVLYRYGPSVRRKGTPLLPGAVCASLLWVAISGAFRLYVSQFGNYNRVYGAIGAVIVMLLWLWLSSLALLFGDQVNLSLREAMGDSVPARRQKVSSPNVDSSP